MHRVVFALSCGDNSKWLSNTSSVAMDARERSCLVSMWFSLSPFHSFRLRYYLMMLEMSYSTGMVWFRGDENFQTIVFYFPFFRPFFSLVADLLALSKHCDVKRETDKLALDISAPICSKCICSRSCNRKRAFRSLTHLIPFVARFGFPMYYCVA